LRTVIPEMRTTHACVQEEPALFCLLSGSLSGSQTACCRGLSAFRKTMREPGPFQLRWDAAMSGEMPVPHRQVALFCILFCGRSLPHVRITLRIVLKRRPVSCFQGKTWPVTEAGCVVGSAEKPVSLGVI